MDNGLLLSGSMDITVCESNQCLNGYVHDIICTLGACRIQWKWLSATNTTLVYLWNYWRSYQGISHTLLSSWCQSHADHPYCGAPSPGQLCQDLIQQNWYPSLHLLSPVQHLRRTVTNRTTAKKTKNNFSRPDTQSLGRHLGGCSRRSSPTSLPRPRPWRWSLELRRAVGSGSLLTTAVMWTASSSPLVPVHTIEH